MFACLIIPCFDLPSYVFSFALWTILGFSHPWIINLTHYIYGQSLDPMGIHLVCCAHGGERIALHDAIRYAFASIAKDARFHVFLKPNPCSSTPFLQSSSRRVNIVLSIDGIHTLVNVVIANPTQIDFGIIGSSFSWVVMTLVAQVKEGLYRDHYLVDMFLPFVIKVFGSLHQETDNFLHQCGNMA